MRSGDISRYDRPTLNEYDPSNGGYAGVEPEFWPGAEPAVVDNGTGLAQSVEHDRSGSLAERKLVDG
jgi:hypothetical protein